MICKRKIVLILSGIFLFLPELFGEDHYIKPVETFDEKLQSNDEDKVLEDVYRISGRFYQRLVELAALYYSGGSKVSQDRIIIDLGRDVVVIIKSLALYIPVLLKNPKLSKKTKFKKSLYVTGVITLLGLLMKEFYEGYLCHGRSGMMGQGYMLGQGQMYQSQGHYGMQYDYNPYGAMYNTPSPVAPRPHAPGYRK